MNINAFVIFLSVVWLNIQSLAFASDLKRAVDWNSLKVTWGPDASVSNDQFYTQQPRTVQQAIQQQYEKLPADLSDQCVGKTTVGHRYWKGKDTGVILLFDKQGTIAGIQTAFPRSSVSNKYYSFDTQKMFNRETINGIDMYTLTAYFIKPILICTTGRTQSLMEQEGTGTGLFLQNGTNPLRDSVEVPMWEKDIGMTNWVKGACFKTMGNHYWNDNRPDKNCAEFFPSFVLYNKGQLSGFGWSLLAKLNFSPRVEYPPKPAILAFLVTVPTCLPIRYDDVGGFTTMHLYFNTDPGNLDC